MAFKETLKDGNNNGEGSSETPLLKEHKHKKNNRSVLGAFLAFISSIFFTANGTIIQRIHLNFTDVMLIRYGFQTIVLIAILRSKKHGLKELTLNFDKSSVLILIFQGIWNGLTHIGDTVCFNFMPIGDATAIIMSSPIPVMILSWIFLGQRLRLFKIV